MRGSVVCALAVALAGVPGAAHAEDASDVERAKALNERARAAAVSGDLDGAIRLFKEAERAHPLTANMCNLALVFVQREDWPRAHLYLTKCAARWDPRVDGPVPAWLAARTERVETALAAGGYGAVRLAVSPPDATVTASAFDDDDVIGPGIVWLPSGTHTLSARADGYQPATRSVTVTATPANVTFELELDLEPEPEPEPEPAPVRAPAATPALDTAPPPAPPRRRSTAWLWLGLGGGTLAAAGVSHYAAWNAKRDAERLRVSEGFEDADASYRRWRAVTIGLYGVGVAITAYGLYRSLRPAHDRRWDVAAVVAPDGAYVAWEWRL